jgi:thymidine phosphorylase
MAAIMSRMFSPTECIHRKTRGAQLTGDQINAFVAGIADGLVTDAQLGAFTMAVRFNGMNALEQTALTLAMRDSGRKLQWDGLGGPVLDKHSTGGVGDWVSLALAPIVAACGGYVPMISGRGLGHTGGTLDKLESIPGYSVNLDLERLHRQVRETGMAMTGQGPDLAPADGRMYAVRDVTATVESIPLIVASILSKKLAEGLDGLVLDVKTGNGAFMRQREDSVTLAREMCDTAGRAGTHCSALITDMNQPLGHNAGNALELLEAVDFLTGRYVGSRMKEVTLALVAEMLLLGKLEATREAALQKAQDALDSGLAAEKFARNVADQGGPGDFLERPHHYLAAAPVMRPLPAPAGGWVSGFDTRALGMAVSRLGGGRMQVEDTIDPRVGLTGLCSVGDRVEQGQPLCMVHADSEQQADECINAVAESIELSGTSCSPLPSIHEYITGA